MADEDIEKEQTLRDIYYSPTQGFRSTENIFQQAKKELPNLKRQDVVNFLKAQKSYTMYKHRTMTKTFKQTWVNDFDQLQVDLIDFSNSTNIKARDNDGYNYVLSCVEILSRFAFTAKIKDKKTASVSPELEKILNEYKQKFEKYPKIIQFDEGSEFKKDVQKMVQDKGIEIWVARGKAHVVERFNRTLEEKMKKYFIHLGKNRWVDVLPKLTENYNSQVHRSIRMAPDDVNEENKHQVWMKSFGKAKGPIPEPKYKVDDKVSVYDYFMHSFDTKKWKNVDPAAYKADVERRRDPSGRARSERDPTRKLKKYTIKFSDEIFSIHEVRLGHPPTYKLYSDKTNDEIFGIFYEWELSHVK